MGDRRGVYRFLVGKPEGKRPLGRPRRRCEDNIKGMFRKGNGVKCTGLTLLRVGRRGGFMEWGNKVLGSEKCGKFLD
jgi:hypothetical protein